jgi:SAM-dependent methyltransferase
MEHSHVDRPSAWVLRWASLIRPGGRVLDVASGSGRHARWLAAHGFAVDALDRDAQALAQLAGVPGVTAHCADIENAAWPCARGVYDGVIVTNYLHRPLFGELLAALAPGGVLIYETFAKGNERFGRPSNPAFLLAPGELLEVVRGRLRVVAYEDLQVDEPKPAMVQRICAVAREASEVKSAA